MTGITRLLDATHRAMQKEHRAAKRWLAQHGHLLREEPGDDRVVVFGTSDELDAWVDGTGRGGSVLAGRSGATLDQLDTQQRVDRCMQQLKPEHQELLRARYMEHRTLEEIAADEGVTRQAIHQRLRVAEQEFVRSVAEHWNEPVAFRIEAL